MFGIFSRMSSRVDRATRKQPEALEVWSFFSGAGGLDIGLTRAGLAPKLAVEIDEVCCETLRANCTESDIWRADVRDLEASALRTRRSCAGDVFLLVGGPPCQSFSPGGKRAALSDPRGNLIYSYLRLIRDVSPSYFVLENVAHLVTAALRHRPIAKRPGKNWNLSAYSTARSSRTDDAPPMTADELSGSAIRQIFGEMGRLGYAINFGVLNAADYGAAQKRFRFVMLGSRIGPPPTLPAAQFGPESRSGARWRTLRDVIFDIRNSPGPHSEYTPEMARFFELVPPGGNWRQLPKHLQREALGDAAYAAGGGKTGFFRRLSWDAPAPTLTGRSNRKGSAVCHPDQIRPLSVRESARLQGFPDEWQFSGSMSDQYLQIGNAVPVSLGEAIGRTILEHSTSPSRSNSVDHDDFDILLNSAVQRLRATARNKRGRSDGQLLLVDDVAEQAG